MSISEKKLEDFVMLQMIICLFAFRDYTKITIVSQLFTFTFMFLIQIKNKIFTYDKNFFMTSKIVFILWGIMTGFWASQKNGVFSICTTMIIRLMTSLSIIFYVSNKEKMYKFIKILVIAGIVLCLRIIVVVPFSAFGKFRIGNLLSHGANNSYGNTGITFILGILSVILIIDKSVIKNSKFKYFLVILFSLFSILSGSKKHIFLIVIAMILNFAFKSENFKDSIKKIIKFTIIIIFAYLAIKNIPMLYNMIGKRMINFINFFSEAGETDASTIGRMQLINEAIIVFFKNPLLGIGIGNFMFVSSLGAWAENNYLELLVDTGFIGLIIYYFYQTKILFSSLKRRKENDIYSNVFILLICFIIIDLTMVSYFNSTLQLYQAFIFAMYFVAKKEGEKHEKRKI